MKTNFKCFLIFFRFWESFVDLKIKPNFFCAKLLTIFALYDKIVYCIIIGKYVYFQIVLKPMMSEISGRSRSLHKYNISII